MSLKLSSNKFFFITQKNSNEELFCFKRNSLNTLTDNIYIAHQKLNDLISNLEEKVKKNLERQENEFFFAYRSHMSKVQADLKELKKKIDEEEKISKRNEKILKLEKDLLFFQNEAQTLSNKLSEKAKENSKLKENLMILRSEKLFLENKLIDVLKNKKEANPVQNILEPKNNKNENLSQNNSTEKQKILKKTLNNKYLKKDKDIFDIIQRYNIADSDEFFNDLCELIAKKTTHLAIKTKNLGTNLEKLKKTNIFLNSALNKNISNSNELKLHIENCFSSVKKEILKRKNFSIGSPNNFNEQEINFEDFRINDKLKLLSFLLSHESIFQDLIDKIFGSNAINRENKDNSSFHLSKNKIDLDFISNNNASSDLPSFLEKFSLLSKRNQNNCERNENENTPQTSLNPNSKYSIRNKLKAFLNKKEDIVKIKTLTDRIVNSFDGKSQAKPIMIRNNKKREKSFVL